MERFFRGGGGGRGRERERSSLFALVYYKLFVCRFYRCACINISRFIVSTCYKLNRASAFYGWVSRWRLADFNTDALKTSTSCWTKLSGTQIHIYIHGCFDLKMRLLFLRSDWGTRARTWDEKGIIQTALVVFFTLSEFPDYAKSIFSPVIVHILI